MATGSDAARRDIGIGMCRKRVMNWAERFGGWEMIGDVTLKELRSRMEEHLLAVEEVLGGLDLYVQKIETRLARIEATLGLDPDGVTTQGALAHLQRLSMLVDQIRKDVR